MASRFLKASALFSFGLMGFVSVAPLNAQESSESDRPTTIGTNGIVVLAETYSGPMDQTSSSTSKPQKAPAPQSKEIRKVSQVTFNKSKDEPVYYDQVASRQQEIIDRPVPELRPEIQTPLGQAQQNAEELRRRQLEAQRMEQIEMDRQRFELIRREQRNLDISFVPVVPQDVYRVFPADSPYAGMMTDLQLEAGCCDEWEGLCRIKNLKYECRCGGLKANPGHLGLPWLRGCDNCETTCGGCSGKGVQARCGKSYFDQYREKIECRIGRKADCKPCTTLDRSSGFSFTPPKCADGCSK